MNSLKENTFTITDDTSLDEIIKNIDKLDNFDGLAVVLSKSELDRFNDILNGITSGGNFDKKSIDNLVRTFLINLKIERKQKQKEVDEAEMNTWACVDNLMTYSKI